MDVKKARKFIRKARGKISKSTEAIRNEKPVRAENRNDEADAFLVIALEAIEPDGGGGNGGGNGGEEEDEFEGTFIVDGNNATGVQSWPITAEITSVVIEPSRICLRSTLGNNWPDGDPGINGNPWVIWRRDGVWYAATYEWLRSEQGGNATQECKALGANGSPGNTVADQLAPHMKSPKSAGWVPQTGEEVFFFIASLSRLGGRSVNERSQTVRAIWPAM